jgi:outer membrane protein assembly factor BamB
MRRRFLVVCLFFLLVVSSLGPLSFGNKIDTSSDKIILNKHDILNYNNSVFSTVDQSAVNMYDSESILNKNCNGNNMFSNVFVEGPWPMYCHDVRHTSRSPYSTADNPYDEKWRYGCNWIECGVVINNDGVLYFGDFAGYIYAIYQDGTLKWRFKTDGLILGSSPAIDEDGTIYVGSWDSFLYAINSNGTLKWKCNANNANIASSPAIADDGTIYFGTLWSLGDGGKIHAVNPNGTEKWRYQTEDAVSSSPAIGNDGTIYIGSSDTYFYAMYPNGTLKWRFKTGDQIKGPPSIASDGTIYVGSWDDYLYALYPNGTIKWKCNIGSGTETNPSIASDGTIYIGSYDGHLYAIYPNGTLKWSFTVIGNIHQSSPAISSDGTIYFGTDDSGYIYAVNPDGTELWRKQIAQKWVESSPSIAEDGTVYIGSSYDMGSGYLYAFGIGALKADANGPYYGLINEPVQFTGSSSGGYYPHSYHWDFGDTQTSEEQNPIHTYTNAGNYTINLTVTDNTSNTTSDTTWTWIQETNTPPNKPTIDGTINGNIGTSYPYNVSTFDPDENIIWYYIDWGDNTNTDWIGPYDSGIEITRSHAWNNKGTYIIKVKAKDPYNSESLEATLEVTMPRNRVSNNSLFFRFLEQFPMLERLLFLLKQSKIYTLLTF